MLSLIMVISKLNALINELTIKSKINSFRLEQHFNYFS